MPSFNLPHHFYDNEELSTTDRNLMEYGYVKALADKIKLGYQFHTVEDDKRELASIIARCMEIERPMRDVLERICENTACKALMVPSEMLDISCELVDEVRPFGNVRVDSVQGGDIKDLHCTHEEFDAECKKRRIVNAIIQGGADSYLRMYDYYVEDIATINEELPNLYKRAITLASCLLYDEVEEISDDNPSQGAYVNVKVHSNRNSKIEVKSIGLIFPFLLRETLKGLFEVISLHSLPKNKKTANAVVNKTDYLKAEPNDMRIGFGLWKRMFLEYEGAKEFPYMLMYYLMIPNDEFTDITKALLKHDETSEAIMSALSSDANHDRSYQELEKRIAAKNIEKGVISDMYLSSDELGGLLNDEVEDEP